MAVEMNRCRFDFDSNMAVMREVPNVQPPTPSSVFSPGWLFFNALKRVYLERTEGRHTQ